MKSRAYMQRLARLGIQDVGNSNRVAEAALLYMHIDRINEYSLSKEYIEHYFNGVQQLWRMLTKYRSDDDVEWFRRRLKRFEEQVAGIPRHPKLRGLASQMHVDFKWMYAGDLFEYCMQIISNKGLGEENQILEVVGEKELDRKRRRGESLSEKSLVIDDDGNIPSAVSMEDIETIM